MDQDTFQAIRREYVQKPLDEKNLSNEPFQLFSLWFNDAVEKVLDLPNAMTLATVSKQGIPDARIVLLKDFNAEGFVFFTNYSSKKGLDLAENNQATLLFYWSLFDRQVRIQGSLEKVSGADSLEYFQSRPFDSQISASISPQSQKVPNRQHLEDLFAQKKADVSDNTTLPLPKSWGGYNLKPERFEFWQGRENRLHDRVVYTLSENAWLISRLAP